VATLRVQYADMDTTTTPARTTPARFRLAIDPRPLFSAATTTGTEVIAAVRPDQLAHATPCPDFDVRSLLGHLVDVLHRVAAMGRGDEYTAAPIEVAGVADHAWTATWRAAVDDANAAWADDGALERTIVRELAQARLTAKRKKRKGGDQPLPGRTRLVKETRFGGSWGRSA